MKLNLCRWELKKGWKQGKIHIGEAARVSTEGFNSKKITHMINKRIHPRIPSNLILMSPKIYVHTERKLRTPKRTAENTIDQGSSFHNPSMPQSKAKTVLKHTLHNTWGACGRCSSVTSRNSHSVIPICWIRNSCYISMILENEAWDLEVESALFLCSFWFFGPLVLSYEYQYRI